MNAVEARTRIEDNLDAKYDIINSTANILAKFILDNSGSRKVNEMDEDIRKLTRGYSESELLDIYRHALAIVSQSVKSGGKSNRKNNDFGGAADFLRGKKRG